MMCWNQKDVFLVSAVSDGVRIVLLVAPLEPADAAVILANLAGLEDDSVTMVVDLLLGGHLLGNAGAGHGCDVG